MNANKLSYTVAEAVEATGLADRRIRDAIHANQLPCRYAGSKIILLASDLIAWLEALPSERAS